MAAPRSERTGDARARAAEVLVRVESDGAYAAAALRTTLDRGEPLSAAERGLATELVYGVLRTAHALDARLQKHAPRAGSIAKLDAYTRAVMRVAAYQIAALERVPPRAAVHAAVEALKKNRSPALGGFANAVLRKLALERPEVLAPDARVALAMEAVPRRVVRAIASAVGSEDEARAVLRAAFAGVGAQGLRVNAARATRASLRARLATELPGADVSDGIVSPLALLVRGGGDPTRTAAYREGLFAAQEEGAQCVALAAGVAPGMAVLDVCAGRGGKTGLLASRLEGRGALHAAELYPEKVEHIAAELARLGIEPRGFFEPFAVDLTRGLGGLAGRAPREGYDVVVVDAPCSGLGTLARRPDVVFRASLGVAATSEDDGLAVDPAATTKAASGAAGEARMALPTLQRAIVSRVAPLVKPGGVLVYAVCTLAREEGDDVVAALREAMPEFVPEDLDAATLPSRLRPARVVLRPDVDGTDGFMVFRLRRGGRA